MVFFKEQENKERIRAAARIDEDLAEKIAPRTFRLRVERNENRFGGSIRFPTNSSNGSLREQDWYLAI